MFNYIRNFYNGFRSDASRANWTFILLIPLAYSGAALFEIHRFQEGSSGSYLSAADIKKVTEGSEKIAIASSRIIPFAVLQQKIEANKESGFKFSNRVYWTYSSIILFCAMWLMFLIIYRIETKEFTYNREDRLAKIHWARFQNSTSTNIGTLRDDYFDARRIAQRINNKSLALLFAGILMAFCGVGIFYITLPISQEKSLDSMSFLKESLRPVSMLFFIEALAWFLLKQYQAASKEYRSYLAELERKSNLLTAFLTAGEEPSADVKILLVTSLLQRQTPLILKQGETTESLEEIKLADSNPIFEMGTKIINKANIEK